MSSRPIAAIDVGTNSVHLMVARPTDGGPPEVLAREKAPVRLGSGSADMKRLDPVAVTRAVAALDRFRQIAAAHDAELVAVATSAVREAEDQRAFLDRARDEAGVDVEVISGVEEARLIHLGALGSVAVADRRHLVIDIGGGSTEFVVGEGTEPLLTRSLKLGHIRLTDRFFPGGIIEPGSVKACRRYVRAFAAPVAREIEALGFEVTVGCSGTAETLARMAGDDPEILTRDGLDAIVAELATRARPSDRDQLEGLDEHRRDVIVAGAVLLRQLFKGLGITEMLISGGALREGVVLDRAQRRVSTTDALHHLTDLRRSSVLATARRYEDDLDHAQHATDLALQLFDETSDLHGLGSYEREILEAGGLLHNVGRFVAHAAHHKHSYYLIRNSEHLSGFTESELELIAQVARYHRKSNPSPKHLEFSLLTAPDQARVRILAGLLRVAIGLDRTYRRSVMTVSTTATKDHVVIELTTRPGADLELELFTGRERAGLLAEVLERSIHIEESP